MSDAIEDNNGCSDDPCHPLNPYISFGCVVFPVFIIVWYHYSKQESCRTFGEDEDVSCWESSFERMDELAKELRTQTDGDDGIPPSVLANRFVKWINRRNVFAGDEEYHVETVTIDKNAGRTNQCTQRIKENESTHHYVNFKSSDSKPEIRKQHRRVDKRHFGHDRFSDDLDDGDDSSSLFWECIPNIDQDPFEMCSAEHAERNHDGTNPKDSFGISVMLVDSSDEPPARNGNTGT